MAPAGLVFRLAHIAVNGSRIHRSMGVSPTRTAAVPAVA